MYRYSLLTANDVGLSFEFSIHKNCISKAGTYVQMQSIHDCDLWHLSVVTRSISAVEGDGETGCFLLQSLKTIYSRNFFRLKVSDCLSAPTPLYFRFPTYESRCCLLVRLVLVRLGEQIQIQA